MVQHVDQMSVEINFRLYGVCRRYRAFRSELDQASLKNTALFKPTLHCTKVQQIACQTHANSPSIVHCSGVGSNSRHSPIPVCFKRVISPLPLRERVSLFKSDELVEIEEGIEEDPSDLQGFWLQKVLYKDDIQELFWQW